MRGPGETPPIMADGLFAPRALRTDTERGRLLLALERDEHGLSVEGWHQLQRAFDPKGYDDPPPPAAPSQCLTREGLVLIYAERARRGEALYHPDDLVQDGRQDVLGLTPAGGLGQTRRAA